MPSSYLRKQLFSTAILGLLIRPCLAIESPRANQGGLKQDSNGVNWIAHATLSYRQWQQGNVLTAIGEGEEALKLNPDSPVALINLALMKQRTKKYDEATSLYWQAAKVLPESWVPPLGMARCYILSHDEPSGREILRMMSEQNDRDFNWYYGTARTWLEIDDLSMAQETAKRATEVATLPDQRAAAENLRFLALLRADKSEQAKPLQQQVFRNNSPRDPEIYIRSALTLFSVNDPVAGKELLSCAIKNLTNVADADAFLKLGTIFQGKADDSKGDQAHRVSWLENAQTAYAQAIVLMPDSPDYHFALAGVYSSEGDPSKAADELKKASSFERNDILSPFLISKLLASNPTVDDSTPVSLSLVRFKIVGLNCSCHLAKIHGVLRKINGVAFISTPPQKPYSGSVMVDQSLTPTHEMLAQCNNDALSPETDSAGHPVKVKLEMTSEEPVKSLNDAFKIARKIRFSPTLSFQKTYEDYMSRFQEVTPIMPVNNHDTMHGAKTATNWNVPL
jgi:tetratricopeptide (TPR) repeat protein